MKIIILTLKILISSYLIFFLYKNKYIDLNFLNKISFLSFVTVFLLSCLTYLLCAYRWKIILAKVKIKLSFWVSFKITYMSIFFSNFLVGQQGGDLLRGYYLWGKYKSKRLFIINSIIIDRLFGLLGLLILLIFFSFFIENRIFLIISLILTITIFFSLVCLNFLLKKKIKYNFIFSYLHNCKKIIKIFFKNNIKTTLILVTISLFQFFILTFSIYVISVDLLGVSAIFFTQMALGLASFFINSLPIAISGIGIGEISFQFLNNITTPNNTSFQFASIFLINRIIYVLSSSFSIIIFIYHNKNK